MEELLKKVIKYFQDKESDGRQSSDKQIKTPSIPKKWIGIIVFVILATILVANSLFTVNEFEQAILTRFGEVQVVIVEEITPKIEKDIYDIPQFKDVKIREGKGLFFKVPIIDKVEKFAKKHNLEYPYYFPYEEIPKRNTPYYCEHYQNYDKVFYLLMDYADENKRLKKQIE